VSDVIILLFILSVYIRHCVCMSVCLSMECVGANGPTIIHMSMGSRGFVWTKRGDGAAYVMPDWAGRMAS